MGNPKSKQSILAEQFEHPIIHLMRFTPNQVDGVRALVDWAQLPYNPKIVEVGSYTGESAVLFKQFTNGASVACVDKWDNPLIEHYFDLRAGPWGLEKVKATSVEAAQWFDDRSLDMVYIDASHDFVSVCDDIEAWLPKVKLGGVLAGHDYNEKVWPGVVKAVGFTLGKPDMTFKDNSWAVMVLESE